MWVKGWSLVLGARLCVFESHHTDRFSGGFILVKWQGGGLSGTNNRYERHDAYSEYTPQAIGKSRNLLENYYEINSQKDLNEIFDWIKLNYDPLIKYWNNEYSSDRNFYDELVKI